MKVAILHKEELQDQQFKRRRTQGERLLEVCAARPSHGTGPAQPQVVAESAASVPPPAAGPTRAVSAEAQIRLIASTGFTTSQLNRLRLSFGGSRGPMASISDLRAARPRMAVSQVKHAEVSRTGAHFVSLSEAIQEAVSALASSSLSIELALRGTDGSWCPQTEAYAVPADDDG